ncbi:hypothetical protein BCR44DRAFT_34143 [Catenaria anguillulae PL171]|uniref:Uncharacterized protein n=1 Tax=Catenaria anguillulae PL171 TaxID=765915 RepID=A0A1Y2HUP3_9FUNG|nr:hypothetical protein BCR44DRAFT_34143 [Catenaria anguillulae PL171]
MTGSRPRARSRKGCLCRISTRRAFVRKKQVIGKVWRPGSKLVVWAAPTVANGVAVVYKDFMGKATDDRLKVSVQGRQIPIKNIRRLVKGEVSPQDMELHLGPTIWPLYVTV